MNMRYSQHSFLLFALAIFSLITGIFPLGLSNGEEGVTMSPIEMIEREPHYMGTIDSIATAQREIVIDDSLRIIAPNAIVLNEFNAPISLGSFKAGNRVSFTLSGEGDISSLKLLPNRDKKTDDQTNEEGISLSRDRVPPQGRESKALHQRDRVWRNY